MTTYQGSCHCGAVRFEAKMDLGKVMACNCSICNRAGWILAFIPETAFTLLAGEGVLKDYQFGKKKIHHLFCPVCGIHPFGRGSGHDGSAMVAVNIRCIEGVDVASLTVTPFDGKSL